MLLAAACSRQVLHPVPKSASFNTRPIRRRPTSPSRASAANGPGAEARCNRAPKNGAASSPSACSGRTTPPARHRLRAVPRRRRRGALHAVVSVRCRDAEYQARYEGAEFLSGEAAPTAEAIVALPPPAAAAPVHVTGFSRARMKCPRTSPHVHPLLRPDGAARRPEHVSLLDDHGKPVVDPFLPVDGELWNADRTRYTVFFDPGRQKRGILPNREMGFSLAAGQSTRWSSIANGSTATVIRFASRSRNRSA